MNKEDIVRAWKDPEFRKTVPDAPESPAGTIVLTDEELEMVRGGSGSMNSRAPNRNRSIWSKKPEKEKETDNGSTPGLRWRRNRWPRGAPSWNS